MTTNQKRLERIHQCLSQQLQPSTLEVVDDSHLHVGHAGAKSGLGHFRVTISADCFAGKTKLECHRLIYAALGKMMTTDIHALQIIIQPGEKK